MEVAETIWKYTTSDWWKTWGICQSDDSGHSQPKCWLDPLSQIALSPNHRCQLSLIPRQCLFVQHMVFSWSLPFPPGQLDNWAPWLELGRLTIEHLISGHVFTIWASYLGFCDIVLSQRRCTWYSRPEKGILMRSTCDKVFRYTWSHILDMVPRFNLADSFISSQLMEHNFMCFI